jgi:hypothetical protein
VWTPSRCTAALALAHQGRQTEAAALAAEELTLAERFGAPGAILTATHAGAVAEADDAKRLELSDGSEAVGRASAPRVDCQRSATAASADRGAGVTDIPAAADL